MYAIMLQSLKPAASSCCRHRTPFLCPLVMTRGDCLSIFISSLSLSSRHSHHLSPHPISCLSSSSGFQNPTSQTFLEVQAVFTLPRSGIMLIYRLTQNGQLENHGAWRGWCRQNCVGCPGVFSVSVLHRLSFNDVYIPVYAQLLCW